MTTPLPTSNQVPMPTSSGTLWATASKEWVIPPKPKPGRKPKKDLAVSDPSPSEVEEARRGQNRAAQRAFRTRKQEHLQELQARVQLYEKGEIERNIGLQNTAKRLKEDNERLRAENQALREQLQKAEEAQRLLERKRAPSPSSDITATTSSERKRARITVQALVNPSPTSIVLPSYNSISSDSLSGSSSRTFDSLSNTLPPLTAGASSDTESFGSEPDHATDPIISSTHIQPSSLSTILNPTSGKFGFGNGCGLCSEDMSCICREVGLPGVPPPGEVTEPSFTPIQTIQQDSSVFDPESIQPAQSILDSLPAFQPAVPLRRRNVNRGARVAPIFQLIISSAVSDCGGDKNVANCSGDPSNCAACADDSFGQAFCTAISESLAVNGNERCANCPGRITPGEDLPGTALATAATDACCGGRIDGKCCRDEPKTLAAPQPTMPSASVASGTIPCNQAWQQIKAHPNSSFADLRLLADVVARRSKCTGPRVVISPAPGMATPDRGRSPHVVADHRTSSELPNSSGTVGQQDLYIRCGRPSIRELPAEAVRDALRLLEIMKPRH